MRFIIAFIIFSFVFVQHISAQTQSFYKDYPELDSNFSFGFSLLSESSGYFLLYGSVDEVLGNNTQTYIASFDTSNALQWKHIYLSGTGGNVTKGGLMLTSDSCLLYCGATKPTPKKGILIKAQKNDGTEVFNRSYGDTAHYYFHAVTETSDSGYLIAGSTDSLNDSGLYDLYIMKVDQNGLKQWDTTITLNNTVFATSSIIGINNVYYFTVLKQRNQQYNDNKIVGIKEDGTIVLNKDIILAAYGGYLGAIAVSNDNQLLLGGQINEYYWPHNPSSGSINDLPYGKMYVGKYDTLGNNIWSKQYFCPNILQYTEKIIQDNNGYILGGGCGWGYYYKGTGMDFNEPSYSFQDNFLMKITENGDSV